MLPPLHEKSLADHRVGIVTLPSAHYPSTSGGRKSLSESLVQASKMVGWHQPHRGAFGTVVRPGMRVLIKPNWVMHRNEGPWGIEPLITHGSLVRVAVDHAVLAGAGSIVIGDAPLQQCDFAALLSASGVEPWATELITHRLGFMGVVDFRRTICTINKGVRSPVEDLQPLGSFVKFDLADDSLHEYAERSSREYRVTCYDPALMARAHAPGRHQYLVAKEALDVDVVINLPKLKTHRKAGMTGALKNAIGINGNKEFLPHHRLGGSDVGGDCYPGYSVVKMALEYVHDRQHSGRSEAETRFWYQATRPLNYLLARRGDVFGVEGSWSGNDTIWRTCLDLNRILQYGCSDGTLANTPTRRVIHVVDAVVAGHGEGPLAPQALPLGMVLVGNNAAAVDWVGAYLLGFDPEKVSTIRRAFEAFRWPLTTFCRSAITVIGDNAIGPATEVLPLLTLPRCEVPGGWRGAMRPMASSLSR